MPLAGVILDDKAYTLEEIREAAASRSLRYTPELLEALLATRQERDYVSTTSLTAKCLRQQSIQRQEPYYEDLDKMWAAFRGTMFHGQLEQHVADAAIEEARFFVDIDGYQFSGSPDLVDPERGVLYDYKFCKEVPRFDYPWKDHIEQVNINRWLVDHADKVVWRGGAWVPDPEEPRVFVPLYGTGDLRAGTERLVVRPRDWQELIVVYMDDKGVKPITCTKSIDVPKASGEGTKKARVPDVWDDEKVEELIQERYAAAHMALTELETPPAPNGWEHQSHVLCGYCPVRDRCAALEREGQ